uniref:Uncharacterized protein n=1 Tax=Spongospora subterranea TaxID=70186 RepID=A0A0H5R900_9EUKA|eukprot:CRZ04859.1 hypothetical protein [Spongospora subterranea]
MYRYNTRWKMWERAALFTHKTNTLCVMIDMKSRLQTKQHKLLLRTELIESSGGLLAAADADSVSIFAMAESLDGPDLTLKARVFASTTVTAFAIAPVHQSSKSFIVTVGDQNGQLSCHRIRPRPVEGAMFLVDKLQCFDTGGKIVRVAASTEIIIACTESETSVIIGGSIFKLNIPASCCATRVGGMFALGSDTAVTFFEGTRQKWARSSESVSAMSFTSPSCFVVGHANGSLSVFNFHGTVISKLPYLSSFGGPVTKFLGPLPFPRLSKSSSFLTTVNLNLKLFSHSAEEFQANKAMIAITSNCFVIWPFLESESSEICCPSIADQLNWNAAFPLKDIAGGILDACAVHCDAKNPGSFCVVTATEESALKLEFKVIKENYDDEELVTEDLLLNSGHDMQVDATTDLGESPNTIAELPDASKNCEDICEHIRNINHFELPTSPVRQFPELSGKESLQEVLLFFKMRIHDCESEVRELHSVFQSFTQMMTDSMIEISRRLSDKKART